MGERGPARVPIKVLSMRGSWRAKRRAGEPAPKPGRPRCPGWLRPEAKQAWKRLVHHLDHMGILGQCDEMAIAQYCQTWAMWREAHEWLREHGDVHPEKDGAGRVIGLKEYPQVIRVIRLGEQLLRLAKQFGLTPAARANMSVDIPSAPDENRGKWERIIGGSGMQG